MEARCPRCSTVFTTDRSGIQFCPSCGQQVDVPDPYARPPVPEQWGQPPEGGGGSGPGFGAGRFTGEPPPGGGPIPGHRELTPWERRREIGVVQGFVETWKRSVLSPQGFFPSIRPDVPWSEALYYAWIVHGISVALGLPVVGLGVYRSSLPNVGSDPQMENAMRVFSGGSGVGVLLFSLLVYPLLLLAGAGIVHLVALLFGAGRNGYGATVRALCYAAGPNLLGVVPCLNVLASLYSLLLAIFGISSLQETTMGKAAGIVLLPFLLLGCCCSFVASALIAAIAAMVGAMTGGGTSV
ncbi:MAG TPA: YIP1 family protein [Myxococcaceae bacterium]|nr:YIP1 family protein [Myxococcaceae bacterium]